MAAGWIAAIAASVAATAGAVSAKQQSKAAKETAKASSLTNRRDRIKALAKGRVARAQQISGAETGGVSEGSGAAAAVGAAQSETAANIGFQQQLEGINNKRVGFLNRAGTFSAIQGAANKVSSAASFAGGGSGNVFEDIGKQVKENAARGKRT